MSADQPEVPVVQVVRGAPDDDELVALVAVLRARSRAAAAGPGTTETTTGNGWADYWRTIGAAPAPGPGTWTAVARR
ncbi:MAG TPA: acyl-CoA carboxylase subunit epsilon [Jiangellaceae bacterium]|nr:acyl-CoA carboxylase subunit epsilon [Jiangellaceae bacterium]